MNQRNLLSRAEALLFFVVKRSFHQAVVDFKFLPFFGGSGVRVHHALLFFILQEPFSRSCVVSIER